MTQPLVTLNQLSGVAPIAIVPTGAIFIWPATSAAPVGYIKANGALISRTTYSLLWDFAQASGNITTEANWTTNFGSFSTGDTSTTFRIPLIREFLRFVGDGGGIDAGRVLGSYQTDEFASHSHTTHLLRDRNSGATGNAVYGDENFYGEEFLPSSSVGGTETRPRNIAVSAIIKI